MRRATCSNSVSYEGTFTATSGPAAGIVSTDIVASADQRAPSALRCSAIPPEPGRRAPRASAPATPDAPPPVSNSLSFSGRVPTDPALPVGFEDQLFATLRSPSNVTIPTTITWASETPAIASIDQAGVMHALTAGTATLRATAADGTTATYSLPTHVAVASGATYPGNAEFGEPTDADPSDDFIVRHEQFTASYNPNSRRAQLGELRPRRRALRRRGPLRLLHDGSGSAGVRSRTSRPTTTPAPARSRATASIAAT